MKLLLLWIIQILLLSTEVYLDSKWRFWSCCKSSYTKAPFVWRTAFEVMQECVKRPPCFLLYKAAGSCSQCSNNQEKKGKTTGNERLWLRIVKHKNLTVLVLENVENRQELTVVRHQSLSDKIPWAGQLLESLQGSAHHRRTSRVQCHYGWKKKMKIVVCSIRICSGCPIMFWLRKTTKKIRESVFTYWLSRPKVPSIWRLFFFKIRIFSDFGIQNLLKHPVKASKCAVVLQRQYVLLEPAITAVVIWLFAVFAYTALQFVTGSRLNLQ